MSNFIQRIINRMKELARIVWTIGFSLFGAFTVGATTPYYFLHGEWFEYLISGLLGFLALVCLFISTIAFTYDIRRTRPGTPDFGASGQDNNHVE